MNIQYFAGIALALMASSSFSQSLCLKPAQPPMFLTCIQGGTKPQQCVGYAAQDLADIENWARCQAEALERKQAEERAALAEAAARSRSSYTALLASWVR